MNNDDQFGYVTTYTEEALREILFDNFKDYEPAALKVVETELLSRYKPLLSGSNGSYVFFNHVLKNVDIDQALSFLPSCLGKKKVDLSPYRAVLHVLLHKEFSDTDNSPVQLIIQDKTNRKKPEALGKELQTGEDVDLSFLTWKEWLSVQVPQELILRFGPERITALALCQMTVNGFQETDTEKCLDNLRELSRTEFQTAEKDHKETIPPAMGQPSNPPFLADGLLRIKNRNKKPNARAMETHPWLRFFARSFDYSLTALAVDILFIIFNNSIQSPFSWMRYLSIVPAIWLLIETVLLNLLGTTPGKYLLQIYVTDKSGKKLSLQQAFKRSLMVWGIGHGCGIAFIDCILNLFSYYCLKKYGCTWYDERGEYSLVFKKIGSLRCCIFVFLFLLSLALEIFLAFKYPGSFSPAKKYSYTRLHREKR